MDRLTISVPSGGSGIFCTPVPYEQVKKKVKAGNSKKVKALKLLSPRRQQIIGEFLDEVTEHPGRYGRVGGETWMNTLLSRLALKGQPNSPTMTDVQRWLHTTRFIRRFEELVSADAEASSKFLDELLTGFANKASNAVGQNAPNAMPMFVLHQPNTAETFYSMQSQLGNIEDETPTEPDAGFSTSVPTTGLTVNESTADAMGTQPATDQDNIQPFARNYFDELTTRQCVEEATEQRDKEAVAMYDFSPIANVSEDETSLTLKMQPVSNGRSLVIYSNGWKVRVMSGNASHGGNDLQSVESGQATDRVLKENLPFSGKIIY